MRPLRDPALEATIEQSWAEGRAPESRERPRPRTLGLLCDRIVLGGIAASIVVTPFAFGTVHRPAYAALELVVLGLAAVSALKVALAGPPAGSRPALPFAIAVPLVFLALIGPLQLVPLPAPLLRAASPATWEVLSRSLPGWPDRVPYSDLARAASQSSEELPWELLPTREEVARRGDGVERPLPAPAEAHRSPGSGRGAAATAGGATTAASELDGHTGAKPLSLAPARTEAMSFKVLAYVALFLVLLLHPWNGGAAGEARAARFLLATLVLTATVVAGVALAQRFAWNGRILWVFVPFDWPGRLPDPRPRVSGPFINRNNLAGYLAMLLPLVGVAALLRTHLDGARTGALQRLPRAGGLALVALAVLLSLSRGGWIASAAGVATLALLLQRLPRGERPRWLRSRWRVGAALLLGIGAIAGLALAPPDDVAPRDLDQRLEQTLSDSTSLDERIGYWQAAVRLARDFPFLGAGLGAWPEIAARYDRTPAGGGFPREVHNDYLQLLAETGLAGALVVAALLVAVLRPIHASLAHRSPAGLPLAAAALAGVVALAVHSLVDFDLQIPAIPVALVVLVATVLRPALPRRSAVPQRAAVARLASAALAGTAVGLAAWASAQATLPDPRRAPASDVREAVAQIAARPANALPHLQLHRLLGATAPAALRRQVLETALWLAPRNPAAHDALAAELAAAGDERAALARLEESVRIAPRAADHVYLSPRLAAWLSDAEAAAVERGLRAALLEHPEAAPTLATLLASRGRAADAGEIVLAAAGRASRDRDRVALWIRAADLFVDAGMQARAEEPLRSAIVRDPASTPAWTRLVAVAASTQPDLATARTEAESGVAAGADAAELWFALAAAAKRQGRTEAQRTALERALDARPALAKLHYELGLLELSDGRADRAARSLARAAELAPEDEAAWFHLGRAQQAAYRPEAARRSWDRVLEIDPAHPKAHAALASLALAESR